MDLIDIRCVLENIVDYVNVGIEQTLNTLLIALVAKNGKFKAVQNVFVIKIKVQFCIHIDKNQPFYIGLILLTINVS